MGGAGWKSAGRGKWVRSQLFHAILESTRGRSPQTVENAPPATPPQVEHTGRHHARLHLGRPRQSLRGSDVVAGIKYSPTPPCHRTPGLPFAALRTPSCTCADRPEAATHRPTASMQEGRLPHRRSDPARTNPRSKSILRARVSDSSPAASHPAREIRRSAFQHPAVAACHERRCGV